MKNKKSLMAAISETRREISRLREAASSRPTLAYLIESGLEKAELAIAAQSIVDKIQGMAEDLAKVEADELMPMNDQIKAAFGDSVADQFNHSATEALRAALEALKSSKESVFAQVERLKKLANGEPAADMDMDPMNDVDAGGDLPAPEADAGADLGADAGVDAGADLDAAAPPLDDLDAMGAQDDAGFAGRPRKDESLRLARSDNPDAIIFEAFKSKVREGVDGNHAAVAIARQFGIDVSDVKEIVREGMRPFVQSGREPDRLNKKGKRVAEATTQGTVGSSTAPKSTPAGGNPTGAPTQNPGSSQSQTVSTMAGATPPPQAPQSSASAATTSQSNLLHTREKPQTGDKDIDGADEYQGDDRDTLTRMANAALTSGQKSFDIDGKTFNVGVDKNKPNGYNRIGISVAESFRKKK